MENAQLQDIGARLRERRDHNRVERERVERTNGMLVLSLGLLAGIVLATVLFFAMR